MNRKQCLTTALMLCMALGASQILAANVWLSLNLEFNVPTDFDSGGTWTVVGKADERGIAGVVITLFDSSLNFDPDTGFFDIPGFEIALSTVFGLELHIVQGSDMVSPVNDIGVPGGTYPSTYVDHPLIILFEDNDDLGPFTGGIELVTGTFNPGSIPAWYDDGTRGPEANVFSSSNPSQAIEAQVFTTVRYVIPEPNGILMALVAAVGLALKRYQQL